MTKKLNPHFIVGFVDGEGCFSINIGKDKTYKHKTSIRLAFEIELRADNRKLLERIRKTLKCGNLYDLNYERYGWNPHVKYRVCKISDVKEKVIPFFKKYPLQGRKARSFEIFVEAFKLVVKKEHLTPEGIEKIKEFQQKMREIGKKRSIYR